MSTALLPPPALPDVVPRKRFTREEVERLADLGFFEGQRFELIDGDLIDKMGQNPPHASTLRLMMTMLVTLFGAARICVQQSIEAGAGDRERSVPEPDLAVLASETREYEVRHPRGDELLLAVEVSDTTLRHDLTTKRDLYARAGVPEYWVVDLNARALVAHRGLAGGQYQRVDVFSENDAVALESAVDKTVAVSEILPEKR